MFRFGVAIVIVGLVMVCKSFNSSAEDPTSNKSESQVEHPYMIGYAVDDLPVWWLRDGRPQRDASVLITYLKSLVDAKTEIYSDPYSGLLIVNGSGNSHKIIRRALYPMWAFAGDPDERLVEKIAEARFSNQRVLVFASDRNSEAVKKYFDLKMDDEQTQLQDCLRNYLIQCIASEQSEALGGLGLERPIGEDATLALLDAGGKVETQVKLSDLESDGQKLVDGLIKFLQLHQPTFPNAEDELSSGYEQARRDDKRVLLLVSGPNCGPCVQLAKFLAAHHEAFEKDYVLVKLESRMPNEREVVKKISADVKSIPWMAVLAANGDVLATSDGPNGNIGYPHTDQGRVHFQSMLRETAQRLSEKEIAGVIKGLEASPK